MPDKIQKFIKSLDKKKKSRLKELLLEIKNNPFSVSGVKKLKGLRGDVYRVRLGKIRIIYEIGEGNDVEIVDIDYRGNIY